MSALSSAPGFAPLAVGTEAPDFSLRDQNNQVVTLSEFADRKAVLVIFYPWAFTRTCTGELAYVRDHYEDFVNDEVQTLTISVDNIYAHKIFAQREGLEFPLLADFWPHGAVAQSYGVFNSDIGVANRGTFLIDRDGVIRFTEVTEVGVGRDPEGWVKAIAGL